MCISLNITSTYIPVCQNKLRTNCTYEAKHKFAHNLATNSVVEDNEENEIAKNDIHHFNFDS